MCSVQYFTKTLLIFLTTPLQPFYVFYFCLSKASVHRGSILFFLVFLHDTPSFSFVYLFLNVIFSCHTHLVCTLLEVKSTPLFGDSWHKRPLPSCLCLFPKSHQSSALSRCFKDIKLLLLFFVSL